MRTFQSDKESAKALEALNNAILETTQAINEFRQTLNKLFVNQIALNAKSLQSLPSEMNQLQKNLRDLTNKVEETKMSDENKMALQSKINAANNNLTDINNSSYAEMIEVKKRLDSIEQQKINAQRPTLPSRPRQQHILIENIDAKLKQLEANIEYLEKNENKKSKNLENIKENILKETQEISKTLKENRSLSQDQQTVFNALQIRLDFIDPAKQFEQEKTAKTTTSKSTTIHKKYEEMYNKVNNKIDNKITKIVDLSKKANLPEKAKKVKYMHPLFGATWLAYKGGKEAYKKGKKTYQDIQNKNNKPRSK